MKKKIKIMGLDCPNCAKTLEIEINKLDEIKNAKIEFVKNLIEFESENPDKAISDIIDLTKKIEPNAKIVNDQRKNKNYFIWIDVSLLVVGIILSLIIRFTPMPLWCYWTIYSCAIVMIGYKTYIKAFTQLCKRVVNENLLITISVIGASIISENMEGLMVIALYTIGKIFESLAVNKSRNSIEKLAQIQPEYANLIDKNGQEKKVSPEEVEIGSTIIVKAGEKVPIDSVVLSGTASVDTQSLTGESIPISVSPKDNILSGSIVLDGVLKLKTISEYKNSAISKIMDLVENASENKSKTETFISKITRWYTLGIVILAVLVWGIVWAVKKNIDIALYRGLIFLVISCPCAFAISVPLTYFSGLGNASKKGILIKGSNFLDACSKINIVAFDKTGTLTTGNFEIEKIISFDKSKSKDDIIYLASLGEQYSLHPLAKAITESCKRQLKKIKNVKEIAGHGVEFIYNKKKYFVGRKNKNQRQSAVEVYENDIKIGEILLHDTIKHSSFEVCSNLNKMGIKTVLLSGDNEESVKKVSNLLKIQESYCQLLPQDKYMWIEKNKNKNNRIGYVGDGINDAPSLTLANVGFSMGINGSPASIEASDIVLVDDNPNKIINAIKISKFTRKIVLENITFSAIVKIVFLILGSVGITSMLAAVFADVGVTLLAILNSMRALYCKTH